MMDERFFELPGLAGLERDGDGDTPNYSVTTGRFAVILGSDLVLMTDGVADDVGLHAYDSDGNHLGCLALTGDGVTIADILPIAVQTARALFPSHLLTER